MKKFALAILLLLSAVTTQAQNTNTVQMADEFQKSGKIYVVIATISIIFIGLAIYLFTIDRRLKKIEKEK